MKLNSFINRKRPAVEGQVEDFLGPAGQMDELISGNPLPNSDKKDTNHENSQAKAKNEPG